MTVSQGAAARRAPSAKSGDSPLETRTAAAASTAATAATAFAPRPLRSVTDQWVQQGLRRALTRRPDIRMVPGVVTAEGRRAHFAVSDNEDAHGPAGPGSPPIWAVNIHGYFAGGGMYWRESARLAERLGWRVVNPSLPGFGGSDPLDWGHVSLATVAAQVEAVLDHVDAGPTVLLGHSMGGAVAVQLATSFPRRTLGIIYRDGVATPAWRKRRGVVARLMHPVLPDVADYADMFAALLIDTPDLMMGRVYATMRSLLPDVGRNMRNVSRTFPLGSMLMTIDLRPQVRALARAGVPILPEWGCLDRVVPPQAATEFAECSGQDIQWVPGGHSWMLARPQGQVDLLLHVASGQRFLGRVEERWYRQAGRVSARSA